MVVVAPGVAGPGHDQGARRAALTVGIATAVFFVLWETSLILAYHRFHLYAFDFALGSETSNSPIRTPWTGSSCAPTPTTTCNRR